MDTAILILAQHADALPSTGSIVAAMTVAAGGVSAVYGWFRSELNDCKRDRKELFARVEQLHDQVSELSLRIGNVERQK